MSELDQMDKPTLRALALALATELLLAGCWDPGGWDAESICAAFSVDLVVPAPYRDSDGEA